MYSALYTEFVSFVGLFVFSCIFEIVRNPSIKYMRSLMVIWYKCSCIFRFLSLTLTLCSFFLGNPRTLYGQDLAFRLSVKCKAPFQKKKKMQAGFYFVFSVLGCLYYHSSWITKNLMCCISRRFAKGKFLLWWYFYARININKWHMAVGI